MEEDYTIEGPVTESAVFEPLKAGNLEMELHKLFSTNWITHWQSRTLAVPADC